MFGGPFLHHHTSNADFEIITMFIASSSAPACVPFRDFVSTLPNFVVPFLTSPHLRWTLLLSCFLCFPSNLAMPLMRVHPVLVQPPAAAAVVVVPRWHRLSIAALACCLWHLSAAATHHPHHYALCCATRSAPPVHLGHGPQHHRTPSMLLSAGPASYHREPPLPDFDGPRHLSPRCSTHLLLRPGRWWKDRPPWPQSSIRPRGG